MYGTSRFSSTGTGATREGLQGPGHYAAGATEGCVGSGPLTSQRRWRRRLQGRLRRRRWRPTNDEGRTTTTTTATTAAVASAAAASAATATMPTTTTTSQVGALRLQWDEGGPFDAAPPFARSEGAQEFGEAEAHREHRIVINSSLGDGLGH
eukprot:4743347-Pyramimonas_sp.AAC.1